MAPAKPSSSFSSHLQFDSIPDCIESFRNGEFLIVLDSPDRENEGDLIISAAHLTGPKAAFMIHHTSGYLCVPMSPARAAALDLPAMVPLTANADAFRTAYTVTVDATPAHGVTTGISARDRSTTARVLADPAARMTDLVRPGHVVPLIAKAGGVRQRRGHTEATWEFARLAGLEPAVGVIGELVDPVELQAGAAEVLANGNGHADGTEKVKKPEYPHATEMVRAEGCLAFGRRWGIRCCTIEDLVRYVEEREGRWEPEAQPVAA